MKKWTNRLLWIGAAVVAILGVALIIAMRVVT
jgi:hypothetical protein